MLTWSFAYPLPEKPVRMYRWGYRSFLCYLFGQPSAHQRSENESSSPQTVEHIYSFQIAQFGLRAAGDRRVMLQQIRHIDHLPRYREKIPAARAHPAQDLFETEVGGVHQLRCSGEQPGWPSQM